MKILNQLFVCGAVIGLMFLMLLCLPFAACAWIFPNEEEE